ncbi:RNA polymerase sigma-70 factor, sigma-E family [Amycolatopsis xylanica]|uniref:RNA polymerase sigma-70 factor, sigma-E family n=1 Tax=Amycolatopsis xylanica TaxID=589385 RepID=A0A1H2Y4D6_9PSEU|nr:SigE family RNA polymerase sigma factor [Amycolatopsis xylanica]SDX00063.1 RNA polymerase sigma-70 factor, sigma-E family [Amycolatopsis xylanica]
MRKVDERFEAFVLRHYAELFRYAMILCGDRADAEDLVHDALLKLVRHLRRLDIDHERAYARKAVFNLFLTGKRRKLKEFLTDNRRLVQPDMAPDVVSRDEMLALLLTLPRRERAVITARFYLDLSEADTAALLGCSVGTVKSSASRGLAKLRELHTEVTQ